MTELSGITASRLNPDIYWTHNDSGDSPRLFAIDGTGRRVGTIAIANATAVDWEDIASFTLDGESWLLIADVGDNFAVRHNLKLYFVREPDLSQLSPDAVSVVNAEVVQPLSFVDGPRDCEGVTVCPRSRKIMMISKRTEPPVLYEVPLDLDPARSGIARVAQRVVPLSGIIPPTAAERAIPGRLGQYRSQVTAFDISTDGRRAAALTYGNIWVFERQGSEDWSQAFQRPPHRIPVRDLPQAEAVCFVPDSYDLIVTTERGDAPVQRYHAN